jgi:molybdate transport system substrate-binding protein
MQKSILQLVITLLALLIACQAMAADLVVSAAASLTNAFTDIGKEFEKAKPDAKVLFNFAGSGQLLQQLSRGAPVDVFASADQETMDKAGKQNLIVRGTRGNFVRNKLVLVMPSNSALGIKSLDDLGSAEVKRIAVANPDSVPVGRYSKEALKAAKLWDTLKEKYITTTNVRQSLDYTARGEVDAGFVYLTDALIMPNRVKIAFEVPLSTEIWYPVAVVKGNGNENRAREFIAYLKSETAQRILQKYGFGKP